MSGNVPGSSRSNLWLIATLCAAPVIASYLAFYLAPPAKRTNYGELVTKPLPPVSLKLADGSPFQMSRLAGKWVLLMVDAGNCDEFCRRKLFNLRQLRLTQGANMDRIERVWLISDNALPAVALMSDYQGTWIVRAEGSELLDQLPVRGALDDHMYIIDPHGNVVLRYARDADPLKIVKDLARLLNASRIG